MLNTSPAAQRNEAGLVRVRRDQERRRSNAAVPIPAGRHRGSRAAVRQQLRELVR
jgi:hypothetical protein